MQKIGFEELKKIIYKSSNVESTPQMVAITKDNTIYRIKDLSREQVNEIMKIWNEERTRRVKEQE